MYPTSLPPEVADAIARCQARAASRPEWLHIHALELDCELARLGMTGPLTAARFGPVGRDASPAAGAERAVFDAARLLTAGQRGPAMRWLYEHANGAALHAANLLFANMALEDALWLHFSNKYLSIFDAPPLTLQAGPGRRFQRLTAAAPAASPGTAGPCVSILMPARNAEGTVEQACRSVLAQSWNALELVIIDDASTDDTWNRLVALARTDDRVKLLRLTAPVGPYVAKNIALSAATGAFLTCHDADDWALGDRIERQLRPLLADPSLKLSIGRMLRIDENGQFTRFTTQGPLSHDGALRRCYVSPLFERRYFDRHIGGWDAVRFGGDSELLGRIERFVASKVVDIVAPVMLALDRPEGLTRQPQSSIDDSGVVNAVRQRYQQAWQAWHASLHRLPRLDPAPAPRPFAAPDEICVPPALQQQAAHVWVRPPLAADRSVVESVSARVPGPEQSSVAGAIPGIGRIAALPAEPPPTQQSPAPSESESELTAPPTPEIASLWDLAQHLQANPDPVLLLSFDAQRLPPVERLGLSLLHANHTLSDDAAWLAHVNHYLAQFDIAPLTLAPGDSPRFWRLGAPTRRRIDDGPLVTVIMPAYNAEASLPFAAGSVLAQSWRRLELIIVDDASQDATWAQAQALARADDRVRLLRNRANVGPYVSKNFALQIARGAYVTGHDADDWAHPERIEQHMTALSTDAAGLPVHLMGMLRCEAGGLFSRISRTTSNSLDGCLQAAFISAFFEAGFLRQSLGHWDEVRFAGDSELIGRAERVLGQTAPRLHRAGMVCLDSPTGLTNHPEHGYSPATGLSISRKKYRDAFRGWHATLAPGTSNGHLDFPQSTRRFPAPEAASVNRDALRQCADGHGVPWPATTQEDRA